MVDASAIQEHMAVVGSDGEHVGVVDKVENDQIKLTRNDPEANGQHHYIPLSWVDAVEGAVRLSVDSQQAKSEWQSEAGHEAGVEDGTGHDPFAENRERAAGGEVF